MVTKKKSFTQRIYPNIGQAKRGDSWVNIDIVSERYFITDKGEKIKYTDCSELRMTPRFMHFLGTPLPYLILKKRIGADG